MNRIGHVHQIHILRPLLCCQNAILYRERESDAKKNISQEFIAVVQGVLDYRDHDYCNARNTGIYKKFQVI